MRRFACAAVAALLSFVGASRVQLAGALGFMSAAHAGERGNFHRLVPRYHKATNTVTFEGRIYASDAKAAIDNDGDGVKETMIERYNCGSTRAIVRYETKGRIWAWMVFRDYTKKRDASNYVIVDRDGKGGFDTKLRTTEPFGLPGYLKGPATRH